MNGFAKLIVVLLLVVVTGYFADRQFPQLQLKAKLTSAITKLTPENESKKQSAQQVTSMYKWQDQHGNWHFGVKPPPGVNAIPVELKETNTFQGPPPEEKEENSGKTRKSRVLFPNLVPINY